jgi:hypothetical protein
VKTQNALTSFSEGTITTLITTKRPHHPEFKSLESFNELSVPVWVFDVVRHGMWWGNKAALTFWQADSVDELVARDYSSDSETVRIRLRQIVDNTEISSAQGTWTLYPNEVPTTVSSNIVPITIDGGRDALIIQAEPITDWRKSPSAMRMLEAAQSSSLMVSSFSMRGSLLSQNPAALACYPEAEGQPDGQLAAGATIRRPFRW